eukprot:UN15607
MNEKVINAMKSIIENDLFVEIKVCIQDGNVVMQKLEHIHKKMNKPVLIDRKEIIYFISSILNVQFHELQSKYKQRHLKYAGCKLYKFHDNTVFMKNNEIYFVERISHNVYANVAQDYKT